MRDFSESMDCLMMCLDIIYETQGRSHGGVKGKRGWRLFLANKAAANAGADRNAHLVNASLEGSGTVDSDCIAASGRCSIPVSEVKTGRVNSKPKFHSASL